MTRCIEIMPEDERTELGYITRDCHDCYITTHGKDDRNLGTNWYYCGSCGTEWCEDPREARDWPLTDIIINLAFVMFLGVGLVATMVTTAWVARHVWHVNRDGLAAASLLGIPAWIIAVTAATTLARWATYAIQAGIDYVWGPPLAWFDTVPRRPRA